MRFLARLIAALRQALSAMRGGLASAYSFMHDAIEEAVEPVTSRWPWFRDHAVDAAQAGAGYAAIAAGNALDAPGSLLSGLRSLLPGGAPTVADVADGAVARDDATAPDETVSDLPTFGLFIQHAAVALRDGGEVAFAKHVSWISEPVADYLRSLSPRDLAVACSMSVPELTRHVHAKGHTDGSPLLPSYVGFVERQCKEETQRTVEICMMAAKARRSYREMEAEVAAMASRGPRPAPEPVWDDAPDFGAPLKPAMH